MVYGVLSACGFMWQYLEGEHWISGITLFAFIGIRVSNIWYACSGTFFSNASVATAGVFCWISFAVFAIIAAKHTQYNDIMLFRYLRELEDYYISKNPDSGGWFLVRNEPSVSFLFALQNALWIFFRCFSTLVALILLISLQIFQFAVGMAFTGSFIISHRNIYKRMMMFWNRCLWFVDETLPLGMLSIQDHVVIHTIFNGIAVCITIFEFVPMLILQCTSNLIIYAGVQWSTQAIFSTVISAAAVLLVSWHFVYYYCFLDGRSFSKIPRFDIAMEALKACGTTEQSKFSRSNIPPLWDPNRDYLS